MSKAYLQKRATDIVLAHLNNQRAKESERLMRIYKSRKEKLIKAQDHLTEFATQHAVAEITPSTCKEEYTSVAKILGTVRTNREQFIEINKRFFIKNASVIKKIDKQRKLISKYKEEVSVAIQTFNKYTYDEEVNFRILDGLHHGRVLITKVPLDMAHHIDAIVLATDGTEALQRLSKKLLP